MFVVPLRSSWLCSARLSSRYRANLLMKGKSRSVQLSLNVVGGCFGGVLIDQKSHPKKERQRDRKTIVLVPSTYRISIAVVVLVLVVCCDSFLVDGMLFL